MLLQLIYLRANLQGFLVKTIPSIWKMPKVWFQKYMHRKSSKIQNRQTPIYQKWHQAINFLSLASLGFWDVIGSALKEKLYLNVMYVFPYIKKPPKQKKTHPDVCTHDEYIFCQEQNFVVIKWKCSHFLKASLGPDILVHLWTADPLFTWEKISSMVPLYYFLLIYHLECSCNMEWMKQSKINLIKPSSSSDPHNNHPDWFLPKFLL